MVSVKIFSIAALAAFGACAPFPPSQRAAPRQATQLTTTSIGNETLPTPELVTFGTGVIGGLFRPLASADPAKAKISVIVMHAEQDYTTFYPCRELPARGYTTLCMNNAQSKTGLMNDLDFETMMSNVGTSVAFLRNLTEVDQVVLWGHSGGGAMMAAYQNVAENGASACNGTEKIYPCSSDMDGLPAADGVILIDANYGLSTMTLLSLNPAIVNETTGGDVNETLSLYNPSNGWTSDGANYTAEFYNTFIGGVKVRWNKILAFAEERGSAIEAGDGDFSDDEGLIIPDANYLGFNNKFFNQDIRYLHETMYEWPLLHKDGSNTTQIVPSVRVASAGIPSMVDSFYDGALKTTITRFLSTFAVRINDNFGFSKNNITGVEWATSQTAPEGSVPGITKPFLAMGNTGHYEYMNAEHLYLKVGSSDKSIAFTEGAQHTLETCTECESYPGQYGDTIKTIFDHQDSWLGQPGRFIPL